MYDDDDTYVHLNMSGMAFHYYGADYGTGYGGMEEGYITWDSNFAIMFGTGSNSRSFSGSVNAVYLGIMDRYTDTLWCYPNAQTWGNYKYQRCVLEGRSYSGESGTTVRAQFTFVRSTATPNLGQAIEVCYNTVSADAGVYGIAFNAFPAAALFYTGMIPYAGPTANSGFTLTSDSNGVTWTFNNNKYVTGMDRTTASPTVTPTISPMPTMAPTPASPPKSYVTQVAYSTSAVGDCTVAADVIFAGMSALPRCTFDVSFGSYLSYSCMVTGDNQVNITATPYSDVYCSNALSNSAVYSFSVGTNGCGVDASLGVNLKTTCYSDGSYPTLTAVPSSTCYFVDYSPTLNNCSTGGYDGSIDPTVLTSYAQYGPLAVQMGAPDCSAMPSGMCSYNASALDATVVVSGQIAARTMAPTFSPTRAPTHHAPAPGPAPGPAPSPGTASRGSNDLQPSKGAVAATVILVILGVPTLIFVVAFFVNKPVAVAMWNATLGKVCGQMAAPNAATGGAPTGAYGTQAVGATPAPQSTANPMFGGGNNML